MIKLIENYEIHGNAYDYSLVVNTGKEDKNGKPIYKTLGYFRSVEGCIKECYRQLCRKATAEQVLTLNDAIVLFQRIEKRLEEIIPDGFKK